MRQIQSIRCTSLKQESADTQVSNLISREVELGTMTRTGTVTYTGNEVVGKTIHSDDEGYE